MGLYGMFRGALGVVHLLGLYTAMLFMCNILPAISALFVAPLSSQAHQSLLTFMARRAWFAIYGWAHVMGGVTPVYYGDVELIRTKQTGSKILMSNHVSMTDSLVIFGFAGHLGEDAHIRAYTKQQLAYQPIIGWFWWTLNFIFLKRDYEKDKLRIRSQLRTLVEKSKQYSTGNFWLMIFPEGTRFKPSMLASAQAFSKEKGLPVMEHLLVPRVKGLQASFEGVRGDVDGVIDVTLAYEVRDAKGKIQPSLETILFGKGIRRKVHMHISFVPISEIPLDADGIYKWTIKRFETKDKLLADFAKTQKFPGETYAIPEYTGAQLGLNYAVLVSGAAVIAIALYHAAFSLAIVARLSLSV